MSSPAELAAHLYIRAAEETDPAARAALLAQCFAADGRLVTGSRVLRGPAEVDAMLARFQTDPQAIGFRMTSVVDVAGTMFRYRSVAEFRDGRTVEFFDAGEVDAHGKIITLLVFSGPLADR